MPSRELQNRASGNTVAKADPKAELITNMRKMESQFQMAMPRGAEATQLVRDVITAINSNPKLAQCDPATVFGGAMTMAQLGLRPGVLGHGWLLPFYDGKSKGFKAQLVIGYQGLIELAHRSGKIKSLIARTVFEHDHFEIEYGLDERLVHRPASGDRGSALGYYAVVKLTTGGHAFIYMTHAEMETYRDTYAMAKNREGKVVGPWRDQFEGMAHKTAVRQLAKWLPKGTDLATAMAIDGSVRVDTQPAIPLGAATIQHPTPQLESVLDVESVEDDQPPAGMNRTTGELPPEQPAPVAAATDGADVQDPPDDYEPGDDPTFGQEQKA